MHLDSIRPVHHLPAEVDGTQTSVVGGHFSKREPGVSDCGVDEHKPPWLNLHIRIRNAAEHTYFKWDKIPFILHTVMAADSVFYDLL